MTDYSINAITRKVSYSGSAGVGPYAFTFEIINNTDVAVYKNTTLLTLTTDYTVTINANGTGSVTLLSAATVNDTIVILGARDIERTTDFVTAGDLRAEALNEQLDSLVIFDQQIDERVDRSIRAPAYDPTGINMILPAKADRANKVLQFDTEGDVTATSAADFFGNAVLGANYVNNTFTGTGSQQIFGLTVAPGSKNNIQVYIDGVYQNKATFSISGQTLTFTEAPPLNSAIECIIGESVTSITGDATAINFLQAGTGAQQRTVQSKLRDVVSVKDFGAVGDGVADDATAIQNALNSGAGTVHFPKGTYLVNTSITIPANTNITNDGFNSTVIDYRGSGYAFEGSSGMVRVSLDFGIVTTANTVGSAGFLRCKSGISRSFIKMRGIVRAGAAVEGILIHGKNPDTNTANNNFYGNTFELHTTKSSGAAATGTALWLKGANEANCRANANIVKAGSTFDGFETGIRIEHGQGNTIEPVTVNGPANDAGIDIVGAADTYGNLIVNPYLDAAIVGAKIRLENTGTGLSYWPLCDIYCMVPDIYPADITLVSNPSIPGYRLTNRYKTFSPQAVNNAAINPGDAQSVGFYGRATTGAVHFGANGSASGNYAAGAITVAGDTFSESVNAVADDGGVSAKIGSTSEFRVTYTTNGSAFTPVLKYDYLGNMTGIGGASYGFRKNVVTVTAATYTATNTQSGSVFSNNGGGAVTTISLPAATGNGATYTFIRNNASNALRVDPDGSEVIRNAGTVGGAGKYLSLDTNGGSVTLCTSVSGVWEIISLNGGTISFEP